MNHGNPAQFLCFDVGVKSFAIDIANVVEIAKLPESHPAKAISHRQKQLPLVLLFEQLSDRENLDMSEARAVIVESEGRRVAIIVDYVREIVRLDRRQIKPISGESISHEFNWIDGMIVDEERKYYTISAEKWLRSVPALL